jgi:hypothetical protein
LGGLEYSRQRHSDRLRGSKRNDIDDNQSVVKVSPSTTGAMLNDTLCSKGLMIAGGSVVNSITAKVVQGTGVPDVSSVRRIE